MKTLLAAIALTLLAFAAPRAGVAADAPPAYVVINRFENVITVADINSVTIDGSVRTAWITVIFGTPEMIGDNPTAYMAMRWDVDCAKRLYRRQGVITRDVDYKEIETSSNTGEWRPIQPGANIDYIREFLCEKYRPGLMEGVLRDDLPALRKTLLGQSI